MRSNVMNPGSLKVPIWSVQLKFTEGDKLMSWGITLLINGGIMLIATILVIVFIKLYLER